MLSLKLSYFTLICLVAAFMPSMVVSNKVLMSVFYQSYGNESISLVRKQIYPVYTKLSNLIHLDLVPYGNANTTIFPNGTITFSCQYGPKACYSNKLHACAVKHLEPRDAISFINCAMKQQVPASAGFSCAKVLNLNLYVNVDRCVRSREGDLLLAANGVRARRDPNEIHTHGYHGWKPRVAFNNHFEEEAIESRESLLAATYRYLKSMRRNCKKRTGA